ncbi:MAG: M20/M25/M40 family metallo-hydrolase [Euryarchaeota archaeon]|nr:M20/M25/M40 family metallo-hydrolase [Euryarchaeota archaeon]MDE1835471.1 M20/M25/M40 family metallo-hydrolase [Euryarchaeota archaeon]MDE1881411.1 M20/M25/M40 family metallo-hydrolase [Euryarchaeota archaeon]MDE2045752.1 M20/M25/M40 family metallo-hydrolase [Thermoplasmata archaeon]
MPGDAERLFELAELLVRRSTVTGEAENGLSEVEEFFRRAGVPTDRLSVPRADPVVVAGAPPRSGRPTFLLATHLDTVPVVGDPTHPAGTVEEGRLYGRGALDMKAGLSLALLLMQEFHADPRFNLGFVVTTDEEAESAGAWALLEHLPVPPDLVLVPEPTWEKVALSASGRVVWQASFEGRGGHGQGLRTGRLSNPLLALAELLHGLPSNYTPLKGWTQGEGEVTLPHAAHVRLDRLLRPGENVEGDRAALERKVRAVAKRYPGLQGGVNLAPRTTPWLPSYTTDARSPWTRLFLSTAARDGHALRTFHEEAVGDFNVFGSQFPTVVLGPSGEGAHGDDEWVDLISLERCWRSYRRFLVSVPEEGAPPLFRTTGKKAKPRDKR